MTGVVALAAFTSTCVLAMPRQKGRWTRLSVTTNCRLTCGALRRRRRASPRLAAIIVSSVLLGPGDVQAASVSVRAHPEPVYGHEIVYEAAPGERNRVVLIEERGRFSYLLGPGQWLVRDSGAVLTAGNSCASVDDHTVRCTATPWTMIGGYRLALGDQDDRLDIGPTTSAPGEDMWVVANGGPGDDVLYGGNTEFVLGDRLRGGGGDDELHGQGGPDILIDGDRSGATGDAGPRSDVLDGGTGVDVVSYQGRTASVSVDLSDSAPDGEAGEGDIILGVESITGGRGNDRLAGDDGPNRIDGRGGLDRLIGREGDDEFVLGGRPISCGPGNDTVYSHATRYQSAGALESLQRDCETLAPEHSGLTYRAYPAAVSSRSVTYPIRCPEDSYDETVVCSGTVRLREATGRRRLLASGAFPRGAWTNRPVRTRLTPLGRQLASGRRGVAATVGIAGQNMGTPVRWTIRLKVPR